ncbi:dihydropteroate synthase [Haematomicrobium sanguinis]|uniref:dihydropteroate synthase n=1 Tax=Haematomicrobium sanguinis TaxID=479106 RepID=UPI00047E4131|nr:dihydropteroate synthase [Haematomicrobium sanguinis]
MTSFTAPTLRHPVRHFGDRTFDFSTRVALMAIVNRTPDSFYDSGATFALEAAVSASLQAERHGADWIDIGGVPFRPGPEIPAAEEIQRVIPVVREVAERSAAIISVDTFQPAVASAALHAGAHVINDTTGLAYPDLARAVAEHDAHLVITHSLATPRTQYPRPSYGDVVAEIREFLLRKVDEAVALGVPEDRIIIDPGHDLNKNTLHSLEITRRFAEFTDAGFPVLAAVSNKDFIGETLNATKEHRLEGSLAVMTMCATAGARLVRMHNIAAARAALTMTEAVLGLREPAYLKHNMGERND